MNSALTTRPEIGRTPTDLEGMLAWLSTFGKPRLGIYGNKGAEWQCSIAMHVRSQGASFEINSDFNHESASAATRLCCERVVQTLRDLGAA